MGERYQRHRDIDHLPNLDAPKAGAGDDDISFKETSGSLDTSDTSAGPRNAGDWRGKEISHAGIACPLDKQLDCASGFCEAIAGNVQST